MEGTMTFVSVSEEVRKILGVQLRIIEADRLSAAGRLARALEVVRKQIFDAKFTIGSLGKAVGCSTSSIQRDFKEGLGVVVSKYISQHRLEAAAMLLQQTDHEIWKIEAWIGYEASGGFTKAFVKANGITPDRYRERARKAGVKRGRACNNTRLVLFESKVLQRIWPYLSHLSSEELALILTGTEGPETGSIFRFLVDRSREAGRVDRSRGVEAAMLALESVGYLETLCSEDEIWNLRVEGLANLGNSWRLASNWSEAEKAFEEAEEICSCRNIGQQSRALVLVLKGHLRTYQRRFEEASSLLLEAYRLESGRRASAALIRCIVALGFSLCLQNRVEEAGRYYREAASLIGELRLEDPHLKYAIFTGLAAVSFRADELESAEQYLTLAKKAVESEDIQELLPVLWWQEGLIVFAQGELPLAEKLLAKACKAFEDVSDAQNTALLKIDLSILKLCLRDDKGAALLAQQSLSCLDALDLEDEALAALNIMVGALQRGGFNFQVAFQLRKIYERNPDVPAFGDAMKCRAMRFLGAG